MASNKTESNDKTVFLFKFSYNPSDYVKETVLDSCSYAEKQPFNRESRSQIYLSVPQLSQLQNEG